MNRASENIVIIDYGMGNIGSISNMIRYLGGKATVSSEIDVIQAADKLILPGVGNFDKAMNNINSLGLYDVIRDMALVRKIPFLGICLGMQIMCNSSEEGELKGLSLIDASVKKFPFTKGSPLKVPHMGWNKIKIEKGSRVLEHLDDNSRFYFVHSYYVQCDKPDDILSLTNYGLSFVSSFQSENLIGVQFHPEKSHKFGISLFKSFLENL
tara:strand:- start:7884 stop:8516 length:633 start_codon:yes stop_codon:yes gene_type:complete